MALGICCCSSIPLIPQPIAAISTLPVVGWSMLIGGLILVAFLRQTRNKLCSLTGSLILAFFYLVVIGTSLTFSLYLKQYN
ncbi:EamA family transporter [Escherichia coli]